MTQLPPIQPPPYDIAYQSVTGYGNAPTLVRLATIFNFIICAADGLYGLMALGCGIAMPILIAREPRGSGDPPPWVFGIIGGALALLALAASIVKLMAALKLLRSGKNAAGWGLAAGIIGCMQIWCSYLCIFPLACGIFTIVVMSLGHVRAYLRDSANAPVPGVPGLLR